MIADTLRTPGVQLHVACHGAALTRSQDNAVIARLEGAKLGFRFHARVKWLPFPRIVLDVHGVELASA